MLYEVITVVEVGGNTDFLWNYQGEKPMARIRLLEVLSRNPSAASLEMAVSAAGDDAIREEACKSYNFV